MDDLVALGAPGPPARQKGDVPVEALPADRAGGRLDLQRLSFDALFDASPSHSAHSIDKLIPSCKQWGTHAMTFVSPLFLPAQPGGPILLEAAVGLIRNKLLMTNHV